MVISPNVINQIYGLYFCILFNFFYCLSTQIDFYAKSLKMFISVPFDYFSFLLSFTLGGYEPKWGKAAASETERHFDQTRDGLPVPPHI